ncbi:hypothetical protein [Glycomyces paridis]|uniref:Rpn family recombination-promoting nuclease/putative transposase n=1 Tax=Glycomyces paridis TaxID=2126555 RepID=A0A4S8PJ06_9ACTN|nr:hypothetical protein [Glycomyces paridis]THV30658.1 hypothetical protein E9998_04525 [Glycomyces paridis]
MPGDWHETLAALIADNPELSWELLEIGEAKSVPICTDQWHRANDSPKSDGEDAAPPSGAWTRAESLGAPIHNERRTDRTVEIGFAGADGLIVVGEVQSGWSDKKMFRLPGYVAKAFQDHEKQVELVIVCKTDALARRYRKGIWMGVRSVVTPIAVGSQDLPPITDPSAANQSVQMSVATLLVRGDQDMARDPQGTIAAILAKLDTIDEERAGDYAHYLTRLVSDEFAEIMEESMDTERKPWHSAYYTRVHQDGVDEGLEAGREEGREEGRLVQARLMLLRVLEGLGVPVSAKDRSRVEFCRDLDRLEAWTAKAVRVRSCKELFEEE